MVEGEITNNEYEVAYEFSGSIGDFIVVEMRRADSDSQLYNANLILLDENGDELVDITDYYGYSGADAVLAAELEADGTYTILATRDDGSEGDDEGEYTLKLLNLAPLKDNAAEAQLDNDAGDQYFLIQAEEDVVISYAALDGNYAPLITINDISDGYPNSITQISGVRLNTANVTVEADEGEYLLVVVSANPIDYLFSDIEVEFSISVSARG